MFEFLIGVVVGLLAAVVSPKLYAWVVDKTRDKVR